MRDLFYLLGSILLGIFAVMMFAVGFFIANLWDRRRSRAGVFFFQKFAKRFAFK